jgi:hypothetical protein
MPVVERKKPTFISGGVQPDRIRNVKTPGQGISVTVPIDVTTNYPPFTIGSIVHGSGWINTPTSAWNIVATGIDLSLNVSTGPDVAPTHASVRWWRRVPDPA